MTALSSRIANRLRDWNSSSHMCGPGRLDIWYVSKYLIAYMGIKVQRLMQYYYTDWLSFLSRQWQSHYPYLPIVVSMESIR